MIPAVIVVLSGIGLAATAWLFRLPAWQAAAALTPYVDDPDVVRFGFDSVGLVD